MTTHSPLLPLFKEQLEAECAKLTKQFGLKERGHALIYWYFIQLHDFRAAEVDEVFCDGGGDLGIDAIWIDDESLVHFYQFKNPMDMAKGVPAGEVDKMISGLQLVLRKQHKKASSRVLQQRLNEVYETLPKGYRLHIVSSGGGVEPETQVKLDALVDSMKGPSGRIVEWDEQPLKRLQEEFYRQSLPAVEDVVHFGLSNAPYMVRSGLADCYLFHTDGEMLASLYAKYGEGLLQRNIRVDQGNTATNRSIEATCTGSESGNFLHFNNGITFLCESAVWDPFKCQLSLNKAQVVNGGQTIRAIHRAKRAGDLRQDVLVPARAITSSSDKNFANNVAVNQNNQNQVGTGFLRSNDQRVVQLDFALASKGWHLERREGELKSATANEREAIERRIGRSLDGHVIRLKEGAQAYTATFYGQPEMAKKNVKKIFLSVADGGHYENIFSAEMTGDKMIVAHQLQSFVAEFVRRFTTARRKAQASADVQSSYAAVLGKELARKHHDVIHQVMPQCTVFLCGTVYKDLVDFQGKTFSAIPEELRKRGDAILREHLMHIIDYAQMNKDKADRSWPVLLKSNTFFNYVISYMSGLRRREKSAAATSSRKPRKTRNSPAYI